ncbi:MAG: cell division protein SepF [Abitibacteriaceae bacterium]|nr:cell division protein SepF [Abditibacteriaceae bacterium]
MNAVTQAVRSFKNIWNHEDEEDYAPDDHDAHNTPASSPSTYNGSGGNGSNSRSDKYSDTYSSASSYVPPSYGGGSSGSTGAASRRLRPVPTPLRAREKNIYTLKPTNLEEASIAADYLKTGSAVVLNLESVDRVNSMRIIDFMSGVCYGLDGGHAMKLGETIFLFTPQDFEISSDETDYGENPDFFFKDVTPLNQSTGAGTPASDAQVAHPQSAMPPSPSYQSLQSGDRRSWER